jgi:hypothetical protein
MLLWSNFVIMLRYAVLCQAGSSTAAASASSKPHGTREWNFFEAVQQSVPHGG